MSSIVYRLIVTLTFLILIACESTHVLQTKVPTTPVYSVFPQRVLLLNTVDIAGKKYRDGKEELFVQVLDKTLLDLAREIKQRKRIESVVLKGFTRTENTAHSRDSLILPLMEVNAVTDAIVIISFDAYFYKNDVEVTVNDDGSKSRELKYDIISDIQYLWYNKAGLYRDEKIYVSRYHSSRSAISGALAVGPNIVIQQSDAYSVTEENMNRYLNMFLPGYEFRSRNVHTGGEFKQVKLAVDTQDFDKALKESKQLVNHPKARIAAQANFNCAVLSESMGQYNQVKAYLVESKRLYPDYYTEIMLEDY
jgi:hypothetical protein